MVEGEWRRTLWGAWYAEAFHRTKKLPKIADVLKRISNAPQERQSPDQMLAAARMIVAAFGGTDRSKT